MKEIRIESPAKVNLFLEVLGKREDGYHNVETILETVDLCDDIILKQTKEGIEIACPPSLRSGVSRRESDFPSLPLGRENLAYQAASLLKERFKIKKGVQITIDKRIPLASGLGGGSSNGASVLLGLNRLWDLDLSYEELLVLAREMGADVSFFLRKGRALGRGRGDELQPLPQSPTLHFVLIFPGFEISAEWAYKNLRDLTKERRSIKMILSALKSGDIRKVADSIYNRLEKAVIPKHPLIARIKERLLELGARDLKAGKDENKVKGRALRKGLEF
ncbi:MAG TPA: 4-(cytidine 5'-diphospho)-2-C-methyl-D-erythritol kinase, partial [bacterium]|nr:4-(cytidine 5'-diphospho)-2-C-methyl-D-erythritol kinase [bacterium]